MPYGWLKIFKHLASESIFLQTFPVVVHHMTSIVTTFVIKVLLLNAFLIAQAVEQVKIALIVSARMDDADIVLEQKNVLRRQSPAKTKSGSATHVCVESFLLYVY